MHLTPAQRQAVSTLDQHLLLVACAGSGKTEVVAQRTVEILKRPGVHPRDIVAFTFTEKAAAELKERIITRVRQQLGEVTGLAEMYVGTMHGYALNLLQTHVPDTFKYAVLSDVQNRLLIDRNSTRSGLTGVHATTAAKGRQPLRRYIHSRLYQQVLGILREDDVDAVQLPQDVIDGAADYRELLNEQRYFDFTEVLCRAVDLLEATDGDDVVLGARRHVKEHVRYVVVDEYQDTNPVQERLIRALTQFGANLCVVGDDDQTIYQWRGSAVDNILTFADRYPQVARITLDDNFRSSQAIVDLARSIVEHIPDSGRLPKQMTASGHQRFDRGDLLATDFTSPQEEAGWICDRITSLRGTPFTDAPGAAPRGLSFSDCAVLFRSVSGDAGPLVAELRSRGIPYVIKGLARLFETAEVKAAVSCFTYIAGHIEAADVIDAWTSADVGADAEDIRRGLRVLNQMREHDADRPWDTYNIQRAYLDFLAEIGLREERVPSPPDAHRGELVFYNLGRFSTAINDFERIQFKSEPEQKFTDFANWLIHQAPSYYEESAADAGYARPDAVVIATVHQAKGMQWPAVFVPALRRNRFPGKRQGGLGVFHVIPQTAVQDADRYRGSVEDERRLFYVAVTRAQKYLALSFSPGKGNLYARKSDFFLEATRNSYVLTTPSPQHDTDSGDRLPPRPKQGTPDVVLSFSELKYLFECPYQFKLRFLYGFDSPLQKELGYGKSLHDTLAEVHKRAIGGDIATPSEVEQLVDRHLNTPFANPVLHDQLRTAAIGAIRRYLRDNRNTLHLTEYSEQPVEVHVAPGVTVNGRIDLIRRLDTDEVSVVDFKSSERAQTEDVTRDQLHIYALGYNELTGSRPDLVEVVNLDPGSQSTRNMVDDRLLKAIEHKTDNAGQALRNNDLPRKGSWCTTCSTCDFASICRDRPESREAA